MIHVLLQKFLHITVRDGLTAAISRSIHYPYRMLRRYRYKKMLDKSTNSEKFNIIYKSNLWSSSESVSGEGSELHYTLNLRTWMINYIRETDIKEIVDAPCGDFNWMQHVMKSTTVQYYGLDIVDALIKHNIERYSNERTLFRVADICEDKIPDCDLLIVRDCLFHLSFEDINKFLLNLKDTKYRYLLTTTHIRQNGVKYNSDIITGDFRVIDLFSEPFGFDEKSVLDRVDDFPSGHALPREMVLIKKEDVPCGLSETMRFNPNA